MVLTPVQHIRLQASAPRAVAVATALSCLILVTACTTAHRAVAPKVNVTAWEVPATETNLMAVDKQLDSIAQEFGFRNNARKPYSLIRSYLLDQNSLTHAPYSITMALARDNPGIISTNDIPGLETIAEKLKHPSDNDVLSQFLRTQLAAETLNLLSTYRGGQDSKLQTALSRDFNNVIFRGGSLYEAARFAGVRLSPDALKLIQQNPRGYDLYRLNRMLLDEAYPQEIRATRKDRLSIHLAHANVTGVKTSKYQEIEDRISFELGREFGPEVHTSTYSEWTP